MVSNTRTDEGREIEPAALRDIKAGFVGDITDVEKRLCPSKWELVFFFASGSGSDVVYRSFVRNSDGRTCIDITVGMMARRIL